MSVVGYVSTDLMLQLLPLLRLRLEKCTGTTCLKKHHIEGSPSDAGVAVDTDSVIAMEGQSGKWARNSHESG